MSIRAVIFDVYGTLLEVGPAPSDADARWLHLFHDLLHMEPRCSRVDFSLACGQVIGCRHRVAHAKGIPWPEVSWLSVVVEVLPELTQLSPEGQQEFLFRQVQTSHTTHMSAETAAALHWLKGCPSLVGIASNAQSYTLRELQEALTSHRLGMDLFERNLCFWSFEHGFSKPDPHVFQTLTARLAALGVAPAETLMVGDRLDNDIQPARAHGWRAWHWGPSADRSWTQLRHALAASRPRAVA